MKRLITIMVVLAIVCMANVTADAAVRVRGYYRSNGTYVQPHYRSNPDGNRYNNWSTYPNVNPYTGKMGTKRFSSMGNLNLPSYSPSIPNFGSGRTIPSPLPMPYSPFGKTAYSV